MTAAASLGRRVVVWPIRSVKRALTLIWIVTLTLIGAANPVMADDGMINGPDLAHGAEQTPFEAIPWSAYTLPYDLSEAYQGPGSWVWDIFRAVENAALLLGLFLMRGVILLIEWVLSLSLYRDNAGIIDGAVQSVGGAVFWPLLGVSVATGALVILARAKQNGHGSILGDILQFVVIGVIASAFVLAPSTVAGSVDDARTAVSGAVMTGYSNAQGVTDNPAGFPETPVPPGTDGAVRRLANSLWLSFAIGAWCYAAWGDMGTCKSVGADYLQNTDRWQRIAQTQVEREPGTTIDGISGIACHIAMNCISEVSCADELSGADCNWVRGQSWARIVGVLITVLLVLLPLAVMLGLLSWAGLRAVLGFMVLLLVAPFFLLLLLVPGHPRAIGGRFCTLLVGTQLQAILVTLLIGAVMVMTAVLTRLIPAAGIVVVATLTIAMMSVALQFRETLAEMVGGIRGGRGMSSYVAMKMMAATGRMGRRVTGAGAAAVGGGVGGLAAAARHGSGGFMNAGGRGLPAITPSRIKNLDIRRHFPPKAEPGGIAPPYRTAPTPQTAMPAGSFAQTPQYSTPSHREYGIPGRTVDALPTSTPADRRAIGPVPSSLASTDGPTGKPPAPSQPAKRRTAATGQDPARTFASGSTSRPGVVQSAQRVTAMPPRRNILTPTYRGDPLVITRLPQPVTRRADMPKRPRKDGTQ